MFRREPLPERHRVVVLLEEPPVRVVARMAREVNRPIAERLVGPPVLEDLLDLAADPEDVVRRDGHVAVIEEPVNIGPEQDPVRDPMLAAPGVPLDVRRLQGGQRVLAGDRAGAPVGILHGDPEGALANRYVLIGGCWPEDDDFDIRQARKCSLDLASHLSPVQAAVTAAQWRERDRVDVALLNDLDEILQSIANPLDLRWVAPVFLGGEVDDEPRAEQRLLMGQQHVARMDLAALGRILVALGAFGKRLTKHQRDALAHHADLVNRVHKSIGTCVEEVALSVSNHQGYSSGRSPTPRVRLRHCTSASSAAFVSGSRQSSKALGRRPHAITGSPGIWFHSLPSSKRPARFLFTPPHCLKKNGTFIF